ILVLHYTREGRANDGMETGDQGCNDVRKRRGHDRAQRLRQRLAGRWHRQHQPRQGLFDPPPDTEVVELPRLRPGAIVPTAFAAITSEVPGEVVAAAVGWARPDDPRKNGVIMEFHDKATREEAERAIVHMLQESFKVRGWKMRDMQVCAVEHRVERTGCALAAVALLADDDVV